MVLVKRIIMEIILLQGSGFFMWLVFAGQFIYFSNEDLYTENLVLLFK